MRSPGVQGPTFFAVQWSSQTEPSLERTRPPCSLCAGGRCRQLQSPAALLQWPAHIMDSTTYDSLGLSLPHHDKDPPGGMINLNTGQPNSWGRAGDPVADNPLDALYSPGPLATARVAGAPAGTVHHYRAWEAADGSVYPRTTRDWAVYIPQQATIPGATPAALIVCLDGAGFLSEEGAYRTPTVADNLIHTGKMPPTVIVFINPGKNPDYAEQRSLEYDTVSDANVSFISSELLPLVAARHSVTITADPALRVAAGGSSGGIGAFCMAWFRPDLFGVVISHIGTYPAQQVSLSCHSSYSRHIQYCRDICKETHSPGRFLRQHSWRA